MSRLNNKFLVFGTSSCQGSRHVTGSSDVEAGLADLEAGQRSLSELMRMGF